MMDLQGGHTNSYSSYSRPTIKSQENILNQGSNSHCASHCYQIGLRNLVFHWNVTPPPFINDLSNYNPTATRNKKSYLIELTLGYCLRAAAAPPRVLGGRLFFTKITN